MDITAIILAILSGTSIGGIFEAIRYRKQNRQMKENETTQSNVETQKAEIDLAKLYKEEVVKVIELLKENQNENTGNQREMMSKLDKLEKRTDEQDGKLANISERLATVETGQNDIKECLNGTWKAYEQSKAETKSKPRATKK